jgi:hypothetical protein
MAAVFAMKPAGTVRSPFAGTAQILTGKAARHEAAGVLEILSASESKRGWLPAAARKASPGGTP